jgi:hypothetical protein
MAEIKPFKSKAQKAEEFAQELTKIIKEDQLDKMFFLGITKDGKHVITSWHNCTLADKQYLQSHAQIDIIDEVVKANIDHYIEIAYDRN